MSLLREILFDLLLNALLQIGFFAIVAAVFSRFVAKAKAQHQHIFYLAVFLFCFAVPVINTIWQSPPAVVAQRSQQQFFSHPSEANRNVLQWHTRAEQKRQFTIAPAIQSWIVCIWAVVVLFRVARFGRAVHRVHRLRREASVLSAAQVGRASQMLNARHRVSLLESTAIDDPIAVGVFHPTIVLPSKVLPELGEQDLAAILAHEYAHIRRWDFSIHVLCELIALPLAWHPGIRFLMSRISQTRELACDDYAASSIGKRRSYANTLLRLSSLCLHIPRDSAAALGLFDGDNLEARIMLLTERARSLSRAGVIGLALAMSITFGAGAVLAHTMSLQANSEPSKAAEKFAGTWHWMFKGRSFATMILARDGAGFTGTVTGSRIALYDDGELSRAEPSQDSSPKPIKKAYLKDSKLHVTVEDGNQPFEFVVTLNDESHAEIFPKGAPSNMKPIPAEKVH